MRYCLKLRPFNDRFFLLRIFNYTVFDVIVELIVLPVEPNPQEPHIVVGCEPKLLVVGLEAAVVAVGPLKPLNPVDPKPQNGDAVLAPVVVVCSGVFPVPNKPNAGFVWVVDDVVPNGDAAPKLNSTCVGVVVFVVPKQPKSVGLACAPKKFVPLNYIFVIKNICSLNLNLFP
jgi:hypothetical protein